MDACGSWAATLMQLLHKLAQEVDRIGDLARQEQQRLR